MKIEIDVDSDQCDELVRNILIDSYKVADDWGDDEIKDALIKVIDYFSNREQFEKFKNEVGLIDMSNTWAGNDGTPLTLENASQYAITSIKPNYNISFNNEKGIVGTLDFNGPQLVFTGEAVESAQIFIDIVGQYFQQRLKEEQEKVFEECLETLSFHGFDDSLSYIKYMARNKFGIGLE